METALYLYAIVILIVFIVAIRTKRKPLVDKKSSNLPVSTDTIEAFQCSGKKRNNDCGHRGPYSYNMSVYGGYTKDIKDGKRCPDCFIEWIRPLVIRCALCRLPIYYGDPVALYHESSSGLHKDTATRVNNGYLGCLRWDCCPSGAFFAGHWNGKEFVPTFGGNTAAGECFRTGKGIIGDVNGEIRTFDI